ncbi:hypothetical protein DWB85_08605 [Seongchinamella sediminis]|uniref:Lipoprotein n=1 Tax=Seongchinamella sediminis TaxID=2283635 RepID=A0A3L7E0K9_9GAMM|nr:hypothetical protein [Seongchinamella sediminis]RLQ22330.1 hypothetical protein DWB85_08605 [Seongchinamella sediminis]
MRLAASLSRILGTVALVGLLAGCVNQTVNSNSLPPIDRAAANVPENQLLDVAIAIFDPGLDEYDGDEQIYPEVRKAESRYMPNLLSQAMQESGAWGAVRVVPDPQRISDLIVTGEILHSDGETLELSIEAVDSRGYQWLDKTYQGQASAYAYKATTRSTYDPFQAVYNNIANDLLKAMGRLRPKDRENVRLTTDLLFARSFSPDAFAGYLAKNPNGVYLVMRLPAENDPMLERIGTIRERDNMYVDTMQEYYNAFGVEMIGPYQEWRKLSYEEAIALQELQADARRRLIAGAVAVAAGIAGMTSSDSYSRSAGNVAVIGGGYLLKSGLEKRNEAQIHVQALEELGMSLEAEITPQVIDLEDRSVTLSGNVEEQYSQWRELLADIYAAEIGALETPGSAAPDTLPDQQ